MFACVCVRVGQKPSIPAAVGGGGQRQKRRWQNAAPYRRSFTRSWFWEQLYLIGSMWLLFEHQAQYQPCQLDVMFVEMEAVMRGQRSVSTGQSFQLPRGVISPPFLLDFNISHKEILISIICFSLGVTYVGFWAQVKLQLKSHLIINNSLFSDS